MRTGTRVWLMTAAFLVLIGCILFVGVMTALKWDFTELETVKYEINTHEISRIFEDISVNTDTADIVFALSHDGNCRVECCEKENANHSVAVEDGTLTVKLMDERSGHGFMGKVGLTFNSPRITVYLPKTVYKNLRINGETGDVEIPDDFAFGGAEISLSTGDVDFCASASEMIKVKTSTGDIRIAHTSAGALDLSVSTGRVTVSDVCCRGAVTVGISTGKTNLNDITCQCVISRGNTGDIHLNNVIAAEKFSVERSTGDVKFDGSDAAEIFVRTDTGDVTGSLLTHKVFITKTDTGKVDVPKTVDGGRCEIITDTGDIALDIR